MNIIIIIIIIVVVIIIITTLENHSNIDLKARKQNLVAFLRSASAPSIFQDEVE